MNILSLSNSNIGFATSSNAGASATISLVMPVMVCIKRGMGFCGLINVSNWSITFSPSYTKMAISVMPLEAANPPVVSISTIAYINFGCFSAYPKVNSFPHFRVFGLKDIDYQWGIIC